LAIEPVFNQSQVEIRSLIRASEGGIVQPQRSRTLLGGGPICPEASAARLGSVYI
jgi:hypothetical protein